jgi:apolipoprotein N-acyltransferase
MALLMPAEALREQIEISVRASDRTLPMKRLALAFLAGGIAATGFAPLGLWPLMLAGLAILIALTIDVPRLRSAFATGWAFGAGHFIIGLNWIATAFTYQAAMPAWLGWVAVVLLSLFLAIYPGFATALAWRFAKGMPATFVFLFAAAWIVSEYLRATLFSGFAWNPLAAITTANIASTEFGHGLAAATRWIGTYGVSALIVLLSGALLLLFRRRHAAAAYTVLIPALAFGSGAFALTYSGASELEATSQGASPQPAIRVIQPNINQNEKWDPALAARNFERLAERTGETGDEPRLIFWPEAAVPDFIEDDPFARFRIASLMGPGDVLLLGASKLIWEDLPDGRRRAVGARNALYAIDAEGDILGRYDKAHLVPYGEYLPMRPLLEAIGLSRLAPGNLDFWPGPGPRSFELPGFGRVGGQICYELIFSGQVIDPAHRPDFIFNPSNDAWFGAWGPPQHLAQARLRAIEEGMPVIRSTPTGISAVIDSQGRVTRYIPYHQQGTIDAALPRALAPTLFSRLGNWLPLAFALALTGLAFALGRHARY